MTKKIVLLVSVMSMLLALPVWGADKNKDEETIRNATTVLQAMVGGQRRSSQHSRESEMHRHSARREEGRIRHRWNRRPWSDDLPRGG